MLCVYFIQAKSNDWCPFCIAQLTWTQIKLHGRTVWRTDSAMIFIIVSMVRLLINARQNAYRTRYAEPSRIAPRVAMHVLCQPLSSVKRMKMMMKNLLFTASKVRFQILSLSTNDLLRNRSRGRSWSRSRTQRRNHKWVLKLFYKCVIRNKEPY